MKILMLTLIAGAIIREVGGYNIVSRAYNDFDNKNLEVKTTEGIVRGFLAKTCRKQLTIAGFRGIPYAEPPVGKLRFRDPVPKAKWDGVYDATFQRPGCIQGSVNQGLQNFPIRDHDYDENCLYLNVYTPNLKYLENGKGPLKAVMVFIHGGAFTRGSSYETTYAPDYLLEQKVIVVTMNYRLGAFGFLSLQNSDVPGNAGLKDQNIALKWVKKNIKFFGGDPNKITIFGESSGSVSANYHLLSKTSEGLFDAVIMESGTVLSSWAYTSPKSALEKAKKLGANLKCRQNTDIAKFLDCLQKIPAEVIAKSQQKILTLQDFTSMEVVPFAPTQEPNVTGAFITSPPSDLLFSGNFTKVPVIIGCNSAEGLVLYPVFKDNILTSLLLTIIGTDFSRMVPLEFDIKPMTMTAIKIHRAMSKYYFKNRIVNERQLPNVYELIGDVNFFVPTQITAKVMAEYSPYPVYNYHFTYDGGYGIYKTFFNINASGACHADELGYLFYTPGFHRNCAEHEDEVAPKDELTLDRMTKMWSDFAKTRDPTPKIDGIITDKWLPFSAKANNYFNIGENLTASTDLKLNTMNFWNEIFLFLLNQNNSRTLDFEGRNFIVFGW